MRREIFGPILPILTYGEPQEVVDAINVLTGRSPFIRSPAKD